MMKAQGRFACLNNNEKSNFVVQFDDYMKLIVVRIIDFH